MKQFPEYIWSRNKRANQGMAWLQGSVCHVQETGFVSVGSMEEQAFVSSDVCVSPPGMGFPSPPCENWHPTITDRINLGLETQF